MCITQKETPNQGEKILQFGVFCGGYSPKRHLTHSDILREAIPHCCYFATAAFQSMIEKPVYFCRHSGTRIPSGVWLFSSRAAKMRGRARAEPLSVWQR